MTEQAKEARRAYKRKWAKENPDKIKAQQERYWNKKAKSGTSSPAGDQSGDPTANQSADQSAAHDAGNAGG